MLQDLLKGLVDSGAIKARTKWKTVYPSFADDNRYLDILGNPGSNPLELFWDVVDDLDQRLDAKMVIVEGAIRRYNAKLDASAKEARVKKEEGDEVRKEEEGEDRVKKEEEEEEVRHFAVLPETTEEEFMKVIREDEDEKLLRMKEDELEEVFQTVSFLFLPCLSNLSTIILILCLLLDRCTTRRSNGKLTRDAARRGS